MDTPPNDRWARPSETALGPPVPLPGGVARDVGSPTPNSAEAAHTPPLLYSSMIFRFSLLVEN